MNHTPSNLSIPGPWGLPVLGVLPWVWKNPLNFLESMVHRYGNVVRFRLGRKDAYLIADPDLIGQVFQQPNIEATQNKFNAPTRTVFGEGLVTLRGEEWQTERRILQPAFSKGTAVSLTDLFVDETRRRLANWRNSAIIDVAEEMRILTSQIATRWLLGSMTADAHWATIHRALSIINQQLFKRLLFPSLAKIPTSGNRLLQNALDELHAIIDEAISYQQPNQFESDYFPLTDYLRPRTNPKRVRDHLLTLLFGGQETTANALAWCLYLIAAHPNVAKKLKDEQERIFGTSLPTSDDIAKLAYTRASLEEAMRLYPPSYVLTPRNGDRTLVGEYVVPPYAQLIISQYVMHRHLNYWKQPTEFKPERFEAPRRKFIYFPFGAGPKVCVGAQIAMQEMSTILSMITQTYRLELINGHFPAPQPWTTLRPQEGVMVRLKPF